MPKEWDSRWKELARVWYLNAKRDGRRFFAKDIEVQFALIGEDDYPKERTIREWVREADQLSQTEREPYLYVRWPETFQLGVVPWEASRAFLDLRAAFGHPLTVRRVLWHWHVVLAAPELSASEQGRFIQRELSRSLSADDARPGGLQSHDARAAEYYLAWRAWEMTDEGYRERLKRDAPEVRMWTRGMSGDSPEALAEYFGTSVAEAEAMIEQNEREQEEDYKRQQESEEAEHGRE